MKILQRQDWAARAIERMKAQKITRETLSQALGVTPSAISHYLTGRRDPSLQQLSHFAAVLHISPAELVYGIHHAHPSIPILSWTQVPTWDPHASHSLQMAANETLAYLYAENAAIYALRVQGDAMFSPLSATQSFRENTIIIVDPIKTPLENQFVIAVCTQTHEAILRQYVKTQGNYYLKPINQQYPMVVVDNTIQFKGVVVAQVVVYE